jgi:hypothetical protein
MKRFALLLVCLVILGCDQQKQPAQLKQKPGSQATQKTFLLFVKIPDPVLPLERGKKYEDPLDAFLKAKGLGEVSGGGSQLSQPNAAGQRSIEWVGVDVEVYDPDKALPFVIEKLKELGVPNGTVIEQSEPVERTIDVK